LKPTLALALAGLLALSGCAGPDAFDQLAAPPVPPADLAMSGSHIYSCDGGASLKVTCGTETDGTRNVVLTIGGADFRLLQEPDSARYSWPSDGSNYVWLADQRSLFWHDGASGRETPALTGCRVG
jgi:Membrane-bound lysozyme-inhibitor of c-type lysozyme